LIWDKNLGGTDRHTDPQTHRQTDRAIYRVAPQLKTNYTICFILVLNQN